MRKQMITPAVTAAAVLLIAVFLAAPGMIFRGTDGAKDGKIRETAAAKTGIPEQLYQFSAAKALYIDHHYTAASAVEKTFGKGDGAEQLIVDQTAERTYKAGTAEDFSEIQQAGMIPQPVRYTAEGDIPNRESENGVLVEPASGLAVDIWWESDTAADADILLAGYMKYLGLEAVDDWEEVRFSSVYTGDVLALYSKQTQVYLRCDIHEADGRYRLGASSLTESEFEAVLAIGEG